MLPDLLCILTLTGTLVFTHAAVNLCYFPLQESYKVVNTKSQESGGKWFRRVTFLNGSVPIISVACANLASVLGSWHLWVACRQWWWGGGGPRAAQTSSPSLEVSRNAMCGPGGPYLSGCLVELMCLVTFVKDIHRCCCSSRGRQRLIRSEFCPGCRVRQLKLNLHFLLHATNLGFDQISFLAQDILK